MARSYRFEVEEKFSSNYTGYNCDECDRPITANGLLFDHIDGYTDFVCRACYNVLSRNTVETSTVGSYR